MNCTCKTPEPRMKNSENGISSYCNRCSKSHETKPSFEVFLEKHNLMQKGKRKTDPIVDKVVASFKQRSKVGIEKYGTTLEENNSDDYLQHLQEELMDAVLYIEKLKSLRNI
jgi:hypothetical protein